jgi:hypothetical protein
MTGSIRMVPVFRFGWPFQVSRSMAGDPSRASGETPALSHLEPFSSPVAGKGHRVRKGLTSPVIPAGPLVTEPTWRVTTHGNHHLLPVRQVTARHSTIPV